MGGNQREHILATTRELLRRRSEEDGAVTGRVTIGDVAASAGVGRSTVYRHFKDKAALLRAAGASNGSVPLPADPRGRIIEAALDEFAERGVHATTLGDIAARAGLSLSGLHWHFRTKDDLIAGIAAHMPLLPTLMEEAVRAAAGDADLADQLEHIAATALGFLQRRRGLVRLIIYEAATYPDVTRLVSTHTLGRFLPMLTEVFEQHARRGALRPGPAQARAQAFLGMFVLLALLRPAFDHLLAPDDRATAHEYVQIMLRGVLAAPEESGR